jgi:hypothetical protein
MPITQVVKSPEINQYDVMPVSGGGANIPVGTLMMPGATNGTNKGVLVPVTASSTARAIGVLAELHNYAASGDATTQTLVSWFPNGILGSGNTQFPSRKVQLLTNAVQVRMEYSLTTTGMAVASATGTVLTITSNEANRDGSFVYVNAGTGLGQLLFVKSSSSTVSTLVSASTTTLDSTSYLTQILPHFYETPIFVVNSATVPTILDSSNAAGTCRAVCLGSYITAQNADQRLDPKIYHNMQKLNSVTNLVFFSLLAFQNTAFTPNS